MIGVFREMSPNCLYDDRAEEGFRTFQDLIHGAPIGKPAANKAKVTAVYVEDNGHEMHFTRAIHGSTSEYHINKRVRQKMGSIVVYQCLVKPFR